MSLEDRVGEIEKDLSDVKENLAEVKVQVTNHIPHILSEHGKKLDRLSDKIKPLETKTIKVQGVHEFLNISLKTIGVVGGLIWTAMLVAEKFHLLGL